MTWQEEDEYMEMENMKEETNGFGQVQESTSNDLPKGVLVRMNAFAERTGKKPEEARQMFLDYIKEHYGVDDYTHESDEDLLIDWALNTCTQDARDAHVSGDKSLANVITVSLHPTCPLAARHHGQTSNPKDVYSSMHLRLSLFQICIFKNNLKDTKRILKHV